MDPQEVSYGVPQHAKYCVRCLDRERVWLLGIIVNLLILGDFYDIALRDFGLMLGALALGRLSQEFSSI